MNEQPAFHGIHLLHLMPSDFCFIEPGSLPRPAVPVLTLVNNEGSLNFSEESVC